MSWNTVKQNSTTVSWKIPTYSETKWHQSIGIFNREIIICQKCFSSSLETVTRLSQRLTCFIKLMVIFKCFQRSSGGISSQEKHKENLFFHVPFLNSFLCIIGQRDTYFGFQIQSPYLKCALMDSVFLFKVNSREVQMWHLVWTTLNC